MSVVISKICSLASMLGVFSISGFIATEVSGSSVITTIFTILGGGVGLKLIDAINTWIGDRKDERSSVGVDKQNLWQIIGRFEERLAVEAKTRDALEARIVTLEEALETQRTLKHDALQAETALTLQLKVVEIENKSLKDEINSLLVSDGRLAKYMLEGSDKKVVGV